MRSPGINGEGELRGQPANPGSPGKMAVKTVCVRAYILKKFITGQMYLRRFIFSWIIDVVYSSKEIICDSCVQQIDIYIGWG